MDNSPIIIVQNGASIFVRYPNRQSTDLYLWLKDAPPHCCNCPNGADLEATVTALFDHIHSHDTRKKHRRPVQVYAAPQEV